MDKTCRIILAAVSLAVLLAVMTVAAGAAEINESISFAGGDGTVNNPYLISNAEQLDAIRDCSH